MAFEDILKRIREDGYKKAERIKKEAEEEAEKILRDARKEAISLKEKMLRLAQASTRDEKKRILIMANLEVRKKVLERKQALIEEAFRKALNHLGHLPEEEYRQAMKKMFLETVESGEEEVIISPEEKLIDSAFLNTVNEELNSKGRPGRLQLSSERRECKGGFVLRAGRKEVNNTFDSLFKEKREDLESEVAGILFGS